MIALNIGSGIGKYLRTSIQKSIGIAVFVFKNTKINSFNVKKQ